LVAHSFICRHLNRNKVIYSSGKWAVLILVLTNLTASAQDESPPQRPTKKSSPAVTRPAARKGSRIIDDTTKIIYGPKTVLYTTEKSLFYNKNVYTRIDTSFINMHRWTYVQKSNNFYKDLGNMGTALCPIFPTVSSTIGVSSGFTTYAPYYESEEPKYFNTKSPYTSIYAIWGGKGRAMTKIEFSRNINSRWNIGFNYRPIWVDRQIQYQKANRQVVSQYYDFYTTYKSKNDRYLLLWNYRRIRHRVSESGGVVLPPGSAFNSLFDPNAALLFPPLVGGTSFSSGAITEDYRSGIHLLQQYQLAKPFQLYSISDIQTQSNKFTYSPSAITSGLPISSQFGFSQGDTTNNKDNAVLKVIVEEAGIKGNAGPLFYDYYFKLRSYNYQNYFNERDSSILAYKKTGLEKYVGGRMALRFDSLTELSGQAEYLLDGHYKIEGDWKSRFLDASIRSTLARPGFMQNAYYGSHNQWSNSFNSVGSQQLSGFLKAQIGGFFISPGATFSTLHNYIYFKQVIDSTKYQQVLPYQSNFNILFAPEVRLGLTLFKKLSFRVQAIYSSIVKNDGDALQIPPIFVNSQISYESPFLNGALNIQIGVDVHYQSKYYALGYSPTIQQFYVQQNTIMPAYPLADIFLNAKIKRGRIFFKYQNVVQLITKTGYTPTPLYPAAGNLLDFGFILLLFD